MPAIGRIAFLSQSGALCTAVLDYARAKAIGFSKFVSFGNKADVTEIDLLDYLHRDAQTDVILLYLEELRNGRGLIEAARRITRGPGAKPILAIKAGRTPQGASAAASHTGSLAGEDAICEAVFREAGIIRVNSIEELFNSAILLEYQPMPGGNRLAGVMATDAAVNLGLEMAEFSPATTRKLRASLPATANLDNPIDVIGDARADRYSAALEAVLADGNVDQVLVILTPQSMTDIEDIARSIRDVRDGTGKPVACSFMGASDVAPGSIGPPPRRSSTPCRPATSRRTRPWPSSRPTASRCPTTGCAGRPTRPRPSPGSSGSPSCCGWSAPRSCTSSTSRAWP
jgi:acetyltransferase